MKINKTKIEALGEQLSDPVLFFTVDILSVISQFLTIRDLLVTSCVSRAWLTFFSENLIWKDKIFQTFEIDTNMLSCIPNNIRSGVLFYKTLISRLMRLKNKSHLFDEETKKHYQDKNLKEQLIFCCADEVFLSTKKLFDERNLSWLQITTCSGAIRTPLALFANNNKCENIESRLDNAAKFIYYAALFNNIDLIKTFLMTYPNFNNELCTAIRLAASPCANNSEVVERLLNPKNNFMFTSLNNLEHAASETQNPKIRRLITNKLNAISP